MTTDENELFLSSDGGASWTPGRNSSLSPFSGDIFAADPLNPSVLYACNGPDLHVSKNSGLDWSLVGPIWSSPTFSNRCTALLVDPFTPTTLYASDTDSQGVYKSLDGGLHWQAINHGLGSTLIRTLAINPTRPEILYAGVEGGLYKTEDGGLDWESAGLPGSPGESDVTEIAIDPSTPETLYALIGDAYLEKSLDGGHTWSNMLASDQQTLSFLAVNSWSPGSLYVGSPEGVFKLEGSSAREPFLVSPYNQILPILAHGPSGTPVLFGYGDQFPTLLKSADGGVNWTPFSVDPQLGRINAYMLAVDLTNPDILYADAGISLIKSTDGGVNWKKIFSGPPDGAPYLIALNPRAPERVFLVWRDSSLEQYGLYGSRDGGATCPC